MNNEKFRNSNIELLRIISIILIIFSHFCIHQNFPQLTINNVSFQTFLTQIGHFGCIGNHIFIIITGYFLIEKKFNIKKIIKLILEMLFYSVLIGIICLIIHNNINIKEIFKILFPIFWGNWFVIYYILLFLISPFLNIFIKNVSKVEYRFFLALCILIVFFIPSFTLNVWNFNDHTVFVIDYFIGAYIKLYFDFEKWSNIKIKESLFIVIFIYIFLALLLVFLSMITNNIIFYKYICYIIGTNYSIFSLILGILLFLYFLTRKNFYNKYLNYISGSVLGIYLIHENNYMREILWKIFLPIERYIFTPSFYIILFIKVVGIFSGCLLIDIIRRILFEKLENKISVYFASLLKYFFNKIKKFFE